METIPDFDHIFEQLNEIFSKYVNFEIVDDRKLRSNLVGILLRFKKIPVFRTLHEDYCFHLYTSQIIELYCSRIVVR
jgi:hypothetical protein